VTRIFSATGEKKEEEDRQNGLHCVCESVFGGRPKARTFGNRHRMRRG
jgi:hypothetical protein